MSALVTAGQYQSEAYVAWFFELWRRINVLAEYLGKDPYTVPSDAGGKTIDEMKAYLASLGQTIAMWPMWAKHLHTWCVDLTKGVGDNNSIYWAYFTNAFGSATPITSDDMLAATDEGSPFLSFEYDPYYDGDPHRYRDDIRPWKQIEQAIDVLSYCRVRVVASTRTYTPYPLQFVPATGKLSSWSWTEKIGAERIWDDCRDNPTNRRFGRFGWQSWPHITTQGGGAAFLDLRMFPCAYTSGKLVMNIKGENVLSPATATDNVGNSVVCDSTRVEEFDVSGWPTPGQLNTWTMTGTPTPENLPFANTYPYLGGESLAAMSMVVLDYNVDYEES